MNDTIVAISTASGKGAISIIRLSGKESVEIVSKVFKGKDLNTVDTHTINYGYIVKNEEIIDEVLVSVMRAPRTYTTEDIIEINCHGSISTTNKILELILTKGARLAEPGEFTKRAFLNGRIDLTQSEAVIDLLNSKSDQARKLAINALRGTTTNKIREFRQKLNDIIANISVNIDYPEYHDIEELTIDNLEKSIKNLLIEIDDIIKESRSQSIIVEGIKTVIIGRPNVGKSSILNKLLDYEKAIVTDIAGTTRDIVEGQIYLEGIPLNIIDTAGIRKTEDQVEKIGVKKSIELMKDADLVLVVLNNNEPLTSEDLEIIERTDNNNTIIVINKCDLKDNLDISQLEKRNIVRTTTKDIDGLKNLKSKIIQMYNLEELESKDYTYLSSARQLSLANQTRNILENILASIENNVPLDLIELDIRDAFDKLGEIIGETYDEEILDNLFSKFCVGK